MIRPATILLSLAAALLLLAALAGSASAGHNADVHTGNMSLIGGTNDGGTADEGSDLAFWGTNAIVPTYLGLRVVDISDPRAPQRIGTFSCPGPQGDVTVWEDLVFMSVDSPRTSPACGAPGASLLAQEQGTDWEGLRIVSIADPREPRQIATVRTGCGSHTNTLVPDVQNGRVLVYVNSYPTVGVRSRTCNDVEHEQLSVVEVPLGAPDKAKVISTPEVTRTTPSNGCHDVTVLLEKRLAAAACLQESQVWDISDPVNPKVLSSFKNPQINFDHSTAFSFDGRTMIIGDEFAGAAADHSCATQSEPTKFGALWFYDISDPRKPVQKGSFQLEPQGPLALCTAHNFNTVPLADGRDVLVSAFYEGGTTVIDFTDPAKPVKLGGYIAKTPTASNVWSSYWYDGFIYGNNRNKRGLDVFRLDDPAVASALTLGRLNPQTQEPLPARQGGPGSGTEQGGGAPTQPAPSGPAPDAPMLACDPVAGFASASAVARGRGVRFSAVRRTLAPYRVDVFQHSAGRRVIGERLVARFNRLQGRLTWNGRANRKGRRIRDGIFSARLVVPVAGGSDVRRFALRRRNGRFAVLAPFHRVEECGVVARFKLERPVLGGRGNRELDVSYRLRAPARAVVSVLRGRTLVRRFAARDVRADVTQRLRLGGELLRRGAYRVRLEIDDGRGAPVTRELTARVL